MNTPVPPAEGPLHLHIHGRVQGVGFRESMIDEAARLGVRGWVRNRTDGTVEAVLDGPQAARSALLAWAHRGPAAARVAQVQTREATPQEASAIGPGFVRLATSA